MYGKGGGKVPGEGVACLMAISLRAALRCGERVAVRTVSPQGHLSRRFRALLNRCPDPNPDPKITPGDEGVCP